MYGKGDWILCMVIDGRKIAEEILFDIRRQAEGLPFTPVFCDVLVGDDPASAQYVRMKNQTAQRAGINFLKAEFPGNISTAELVKEIKRLSREPDLCGLIVQLPLPGGLDKQRVLNAIDPRVDVDCIGSVNEKRFYGAGDFLDYPTAAAILKILDSLGRNFAEKNFLVLGQGQLVGRPVSRLLKRRGYFVDTATRATENIAALLEKADVVITAAGSPGFITGGMIKPGAVVIDAGTSEAQAGGIVGDVDFASVSRVAGAVSPVPGGVGPVTVACLLANVLKVAKNKI